MEYTAKKIIISLFIALTAWTTCSAGAEDQLNGVNWISVKEENQLPNQWLCFRKQITIEQNLSGKVNMDIAVDSKYWLWINNKLVVFEGGIKRGPNANDTYYDTVDITKYLVKGENIISVLVWYWGRDGYCHKSSGKSGMLAKITLNGAEIITDSTWKVKIHPSFGETDNPKPNYRLPESNVHYDARKSLGAWKTYSYDDSQWENATEHGRYPCAPWNKLHKRPFPNWKDSGIINYQKLTTDKGTDTIKVIGKLPKNITVTPYIKVKATAGKTIDIRSDNYKGGSEYNVRAEYVTRDGIQEFEMPNYVNGHNIIYTIPNGVKVLKTGYRETRFNTEIVGKFECNDKFYNKLWEKSLNTMNLNMRDAIQDPDRERSQWWGDAAIISNEIYYSCDTNGLSSVKKAILNLVDWQKEDGTLYSPVPSGSWSEELPQQMLASIGKYGFWRYYEYTGDINTIKYVYPKVKRYLSLWNISEKGLVEHRSGGWDWADWGDNIDVAILDNAWYCLALESAINMGKILGDELFVDYYSSQLQLVRHSSQEAFWQGRYFRSKGYTGITDDRANGLAILAGFASGEMKGEIVKYLSERYGASPYMEKYILESLLSSGYINDGLMRMKQRYSEMVESQLTTLWEDWSIGGAGGGSINHGWAGGALSLLPQYIGGISPYQAGWETIMVKPQLGNLEWVNCTVPIKDSFLTVRVKNDIQGKIYEIELLNPAKKDCIVAYPLEKIKDARIRINGTWQFVDNASDSDDSAYIEKIDNNYLYLKTKDEILKISNN